MDLTITNNAVTMTSLEIAEVTGKKHFHVLRDIESVLKTLELDEPTFGCTYKDGSNRDSKMYELPKDLVQTLVSGYSIKLRYTMVKHIEALENKKSKLPELTTEWIAHALEISKKNDLLQLENKAKDKVLESASVVTADLKSIAEVAKLYKDRGVHGLFASLRRFDYMDKDNQPVGKYTDGTWFIEKLNAKGKPTGSWLCTVKFIKHLEKRFTSVQWSELGEAWLIVIKDDDTKRKMLAAKDF